MGVFGKTLEFSLGATIQREIMIMTKQALRRSVMSLGLSALLGLLVIPTLTVAQDTTGFRGRVVDSTDAVMVGVNIVATNESKGLTYGTVTNEVGQYELRGILPDTYTLTAEATGFKRYENTGVIVYSQSPRRVDITMEIGELADAITVTEEGARIETDTPAVTYRTPTKEVYYTNVQASLIYTVGAAPGVQNRSELHGAYANNTSASQDGIQTLAYGTFRFPQEVLQEVHLKTMNAPAEFQHANNIIGVGRSGTNYFHGEWNLEFSHARLNAKNRSVPRRPKPETPGYKWFYEFSGPVQIPKVYSGRNKTFFHFLYNPISHLRLEPNNNLTYPTLRMRSGDLSQIVDFAPKKAIINPYTGMPFANNIIPESMWHPLGRRFRDLLPTADGNCGPAGPCGIAFNDNLLSNNGFAINRNSTDENYHHYRFDHALTEANTLSVSHFRYTRQSSETKWDHGPLDCGFKALDPTRAWSILDSHVFSPSVINEFSLGYNEQLYLFNSQCAGSDLLKLVDPDGLIDFGGRTYSLGKSGAPQIIGQVIGNISNIGGSFDPGPTNSLGGGNAGFGTRTDANAVTIKNNVSVTTGDHLVKVGLSYIHGLDSRDRPNKNEYGNWTYTGNFTGWDFGDILLGLPWKTQIASPRGELLARSKQIGVFFQDDWKVTPDLTITPGLRFQHYTPGSDGNGQFYNFDLQHLLDGGTGRVVIPNGSDVFVNPAFPKEIPVVQARDADFPDSLFKFKGILVQPRLGVAYRLTDSTVLRAGFGIYHVPLAPPDYLQQAIFGFERGPFEPVETFENSIKDGVPLFTADKAFPAPGSNPDAFPLQSVNAILLDARSKKWPYDTQWNITLEKELGSGFTGRLSYVGTKGTQWTYNVNMQTPAASTIPYTPDRKNFCDDRWEGFYGAGAKCPYSNIIDYRLGGNSNYHGVEAEILRQFSSGLYLRSWIEYRSILNDVEGGRFGWVGPGGFATEDPFDRSRDKGWTNGNTPLRARVVAVYSLPFGKGQRFLSNAGGFMNQLLGNWTVTPILTLDAFRRTTPNFQGADSPNVGRSGGRPDILPGCKPNGFGSASDAPGIIWDRGCFKIPEDGFYGSASRGTLIQPRSPNLRLHLFKVFPLTPYENGPYFKLEAYIGNPFNHTNPSGPDSLDITNPNFGRYRAAGGTRRINFRFRLGF